MHVLKTNNLPKMYPVLMVLCTRNPPITVSTPRIGRLRMRDRMFCAILEILSVSQALLCRKSKMKGESYIQIHTVD